MASSSVGNVAVGIIANGTQATQEFTKVESRAAQFGKSMSSLGSVGAVGLGPLTAAVVRHTSDALSASPSTRSFDVPTARSAPPMTVATID